MTAKSSTQRGLGAELPRVRDWFYKLTRLVSSQINKFQSSVQPVLVCGWRVHFDEISEQKVHASDLRMICERVQYNKIPLKRLGFEYNPGTTTLTVRVDETDFKCLTWYYSFLLCSHLPSIHSFQIQVHGHLIICIIIDPSLLYTQIDTYIQSESKTLDVLLYLHHSTIFQTPLRQSVNPNIDLAQGNQGRQS